MTFSEWPPGLDGLSRYFRVPGLIALLQACRSPLRRFPLVCLTTDLRRRGPRAYEGESTTNRDFSLTQTLSRWERDCQRYIEIPTP